MMLDKDLKLVLVSGDLSGDIIFDIYYKGAYIGKTTKTIVSDDTSITEEIKSLIEKEAYKRENQIKFFAFYGFELNSENIKKYNLSISDIAFDLEIFGVTELEIQEYFSCLFN